MIKLETLDICKVCKAREYGFKDKTKVEEAVKEAQDHAWIKDPNRNIKGMLYCYRDGNWVFPSKCEKCTEFDCVEKKKLRERMLYGNV